MYCSGGDDDVDDYKIYTYTNTILPPPLPLLLQVGADIIGLEIAEEVLKAAKRQKQNSGAVQVWMDGIVKNVKKLLA